MQMLEILIRLFHNHVGEQHAVDSGGRSGGAETLHPKTENRIVIGEDDQADSRSFCAQFFCQGENIFEPSTASHGTLAGTLDHRPICQWIAEGNTKFHHVRTVVNRRQRNCMRRRQVWIAGRQVSNKAGFICKADRHSFCSSSLQVQLARQDTHILVAAAGKVQTSMSCGMKASAQAELLRPPRVRSPAPGECPRAAPGEPWRRALRRRMRKHTRPGRNRAAPRVPGQPMA